jgi:hypothetical protein
MLQKIGARISYVNVALTFALVFAMSGGAYAASKYIITSTKQISPKVLKELKGKAGPAGKNGAAGAMGAAGSTGPQGPAGAPGAKGNTGAEGPQGSSGPEGPQGSPGVFAEFLPGGKTLKGDWSIAQKASGEEFASTTVSFSIPLEKAPTVVYVKEGGPTPSGCTGDVEEPGAEAGHLCVFAANEKNSEAKFGSTQLPTTCPIAKSESNGGGAFCFAGAPGTADPYGFSVLALVKEAGIVNIGGSWAVTAE